MTAGEEGAPAPAARRWWLLVGIVVVSLAAIALILFLARPADSGSTASSAADFDAVQAEAHVSFVNTSQEAFARYAAVPLADPGGSRVLGNISCERMYSTRTVTSCLTSDFGITTTYQAQTYDNAFQQLASWSLPGAPSRTTVSPDGKLVATTVFVTGDSYLDEGFSTRTVIRSVTGGEPNSGSMEKFSFTKDGKPYSAQDINVWGVTFGPDSRNTFYVSVSTDGVVYLAKGDLAARTVEFLRPNAECPSLSPDGSTIAYKYLVSPGRWRFHILTLATGEDRELGETRSVDDQVQWLDDTHIVYGVPRENAAPAFDVYSLPTDGQPPTLLIENARSPSIVPAPAEED